MLLSHILQQLLTYPFGISNLSGEIHNYFMQLSNMKVSLDMYSYMMQNYIITAILLQKAILLWLTLRNFRCYFLLVNDRNPRDSQSLYQQSVRYTAIGICSCVGALNAITQYTISLFWLTYYLEMDKANRRFSYAQSKWLFQAILSL